VLLRLFPQTLQYLIINSNNKVRCHQCPVRLSKHGYDDDSLVIVMMFEENKTQARIFLQAGSVGDSLKKEARIEYHMSRLLSSLSIFSGIIFRSFSLDFSRNAVENYAYNYYLSQLRIGIEQAFGYLPNWRKIFLSLSMSIQTAFGYYYCLKPSN
jgi:hypothetical protein